MSKPNPEKAEQAMDTFRKGVTKLVDDTLTAGVAAPNLVLVLEMTKINLAMQYIQNAQMAIMQEEAAEMANRASGKSKGGIHLPPGVKG